MTPNESLHLLMWYQQDWDITTTFIASLLQQRGTRYQTGALLLCGGKIPPPPPRGSGGSAAEKYTPTPVWHGEKQPPPGVRDTHTPAGMSTLTTTGALPTDTPTKEDEADHGTLIAVAIHQAHGMEPRQEAQGTLPHMRRAN